MLKLFAVRSFHPPPCRRNRFELGNHPETIPQGGCTRKAPDRHPCPSKPWRRRTRQSLSRRSLGRRRMRAKYPFFSHSPHSPYSATHCPPKSYEYNGFHYSKFTIKIRRFGSKTALPSKLFSLLQTRNYRGDPKVTPSIRGFLWGQKPPFWPSFRLHRAKGSFSTHAIIPTMKTFAHRKGVSAACPAQLQQRRQRRHLPPRFRIGEAKAGPQSMPQINTDEHR
jgi:hypothetical protein